MKPFHQSLILFSVLNFTAAYVVAFEREHDAHEHGHAKLLIATESNIIDMEFHSPAVNIVGFEHAASSAEDKQKVAAAVKSLSKADLFSFDAAAQCKLITADVNSELLGNKHNDEHSEFEVSYRVDCKNMAALKKITVNLFSAFPSLDEVDAEIAGTSSQQKMELDAKNTVIPFK